jgi:hypothetical protein
VFCPYGVKNLNLMEILMEIEEIKRDEIVEARVSQGSVM